MSSSPAEIELVRRRCGWSTGVVVTVLTEAVTLYLRFGLQRTAVEFNRTAPLLLQIHHMFWAVPLLPLIALVWRRPGLGGALCGIAWGFVISDLAHHFLILPALIGDTGWHWP
jgi:hypothetical protein